MGPAPAGLRRLALLAAFASAHWACRPQAPTGPDAGGLDACAAEFCGAYRCDERFGHCLTRCVESMDCVAGFSCVGGFCVGAQCTPQTAAATCAGYACVLGRCSRDCAQGPCTPGFYCRGDTGACLPRCKSPFDPACGGYACEVAAGECEPYCLAGELDCAPGFVCSSAMTCQAP